MKFNLTKRSHILKQVLQGWLQGVVTAVILLTAVQVVLVVRAGGATHPSMSLDSRGHKPLTKLVWATSHVLRALINNLISFCLHNRLMHRLYITVQQVVISAEQPTPGL